MDPQISKLMSKVDQSCACSPRNDYSCVHEDLLLKTHRITVLHEHLHGQTGYIGQGTCGPPNVAELNIIPG